MIDIDPIKALNYGAMGLGLVLAYFSYSLLSKEQGRNAEPRQPILMSIYIFMVFSIILTVAGITSEYLKSNGAKVSANPKTTLGPLSPTSISKNNIEQYLFGAELSWPVKYIGDGSKYQHFASQDLLVYAEFPDGINQGDLKSCLGDKQIILSGTLSKAPSDRYFLLTNAGLLATNGLTIQCSRQLKAAAD